MIKRKKKASSSIGYTFLFFIVMLMFVVSMYMTQVAKLMTHQHHITDALTDSVLASLVADDVYYFETFEETGTPVVRLRDVSESYSIYKDCMTDAISGTEGFYYNFKFDTFICYEVEGSSIKITTYNENGNKTVVSGSIGSVRAPTGELITKTSAYGKVRFDIQSILDGSLVTKTKDIYCALEIN